MHRRDFGAIAIGSCLAGCGPAIASGDAAPTYDLRVTAVVETPLGVSDAEVVQALAMRGPQLRYLRPTGGPAVELAARVSLSREPSSDGREVLWLAAEIPAPPGLRGEAKNLDTTVQLEAGVTADGVERSAEFSASTRDLQQAGEHLVAALDARLALLHGGVDAVREMLGSGDPNLVVLALEVARERRLHAVADEVLALCLHEDEWVALQALDTLSRVGDERHAGRLARSARIRDRASALRLFDTLATLGGPTAVSFLSFAAGAAKADEPKIAEAAQLALERLATRGPSSENRHSALADERSVEPAPLRGHR